MGLRLGIAGLVLLASTSAAAQASPPSVEMARARCVGQPLGDYPPGTRPFTRPDAFARAVYIARIDVRGNTITAARLILRALAVAPGECLSPDDDRMRAARYKVLALGFFRDVQLRFEKGGARGEVILVVDVTERGTLVLNRVFFGHSQTSPWWAGLDLGDRNLAGTGLAVSGAFAVAGAGDHENAAAQRAFALRVEDPSVLGSALGAHASVHHIDASEPYRVRGDFADGATDNFAAFDLRRVGGRAGVTWNVTPLARLSFDGRYEDVRARLPVAPTRETASGVAVPIDLHLERGRSRVATLAVGLDRDSRPDPVLPYAGVHVAVQGEAGVGPLSSYDFATLFARYEQWHALAERHVVSLHLTVGAVLGDAPRFDRLYVGEVDKMLAPRALGLVLSSTTPLDVFGTGADEVTYGELGGAAEAQYAYRLFRSRGHLYGGDLFVGAGVWSLAERRRLKDEPAATALSIDLLLDVGLRLDSEIGIFELSLANALGRVPL